MNHGTERNHQAWERLTPEQKARVEALRERHQTPEYRAEEQRVRAALDRERQETGAIAVTSDPAPTDDQIAFRRLLTDLRRARDAAGLSLDDLSARSGIDKAALSRLENGKQLNPTVNTLMRYARALGKSVVWALGETPAQVEEVSR